MEEWYYPWMRSAYQVALNSPDPSTQNGALILNAEHRLLGTGYNTFTDGMEITPDLLERPKKYSFIEHAERNAVYNTLRYGPYETNADNTPSIMIAAWASCADCARAIVQSGIQTLIRHDRSGVDRWSESIEWGDEILRAGGVEIIDVVGEIGRCEPVLANGELWTP